MERARDFAGAFISAMSFGFTAAPAIVGVAADYESAANICPGAVGEIDRPQDPHYAQRGHGTATISTSEKTIGEAASGLKGLFGHPKGLYFLAGTEVWERLSYFGMISLLVLYMVDQLLLPGHAEHVAGLAMLRAALESFQGPISSQAFASQVYGLYSGLVYVTPLIGGAIGDRWMGQRNAVVIGAVLMAAGHLAMSLDATFLIALLLLITGSGFLKGNIAAQVGALYPPADQRRRDLGYMLFMAAINLGALIGPLLCGLLAQLYGWHYGFGIAAIVMLLGLLSYLYGFRYLPAKVPRAQLDGASIAAADWVAVGALIAVIAITTFQSVALYQVFNAMVVWIQQYVAPSVDGFPVPIPWYQSLNAVGGIVVVPLLYWIWRLQARRRRGEPDDLAKIATGAWITAASYLVLVVAIATSRGAKINPIWPALSVLGSGVGWVYQWPILFALVSRAAPARLKGTMMGVAYLSLFASAILVGWIGGYYEKMTPAQFWAMHAAIAACGGLLMALLGRPLNRVLRTS